MPRWTYPAPTPDSKAPTYVATQDLIVAVNAAVALRASLARQGRARDGQDGACPGRWPPSLGLPLIEWHVKSTTKAQHGLYEYDAVARLRDSQLGSEKVHDIRNYIVRGKLWDAFRGSGRCGAADRRDRQGGHRVPERPAPGARPHGVLRLRDEGDRAGATKRPVVIITSNNEKELPDAFLRRCFFHYIRFPDRETMTAIVDTHFTRTSRRSCWRRRCRPSTGCAASAASRRSRPPRSCSIGSGCWWPRTCRRRPCARRTRRRSSRRSSARSQERAGRASRRRPGGGHARRLELRQRCSSASSRICVAPTSPSRSGST